MTSGSLNREDFDELVGRLTNASLQILNGFGVLPSRIVGFDNQLRPVMVLEGPVGRPATWSQEQGHTFVEVGGPLMDNMHEIRQVFDRLGVEAALLATEAWVGPASSEADGLSSAEHRSEAFGRSEALIVEAYYPSANYRRFILAPMVRLGGSVTASVVGDTADPDSEYSTSGSILEHCFSHRPRLLRR